MKPFLSLLICCWLIPASAQPPVLDIAVDKTTSLVFPFPVRHVDRGTREVLVQQVKDADHILLVKAAKAYFPETNLSVVTGDGQLYTFRVRYSANPTQWVYEVPARSTRSVAAQAAALRDNPRTLFSVRKRKWDIGARVIGIYSGGSVLYFQLEISNTGPIEYELDFLRFYIRDQRRLRRSSAQELEQKPLLLSGHTTPIRSGQKIVLVTVLEKFTLPDAQYLAIDIGEKRGGRHLELKVGNRSLLRALPLPQ